MPLKNRVKYWRLQSGLLEYKQFTEITGFSAWIVEKWEEQKIQPTLEALCRVKEKLLPYCPQITLEDLIDYVPEE
jgi:hypothetical protein